MTFAVVIAIQGCIYDEEPEQTQSYIRAKITENGKYQGLAALHPEYELGVYYNSYSTNVNGLPRVFSSNTLFFPDETLWYYSAGVCSGVPLPQDEYTVIEYACYAPFASRDGNCAASENSPCEKSFILPDSKTGAQLYYEQGLDVTQGIDLVCASQLAVDKGKASKIAKSCMLMEFQHACAKVDFLYYGLPKECRIKELRATPSKENGAEYKGWLDIFHGAWIRDEDSGKPETSPVWIWKGNALNSNRSFEKTNKVNADGSSLYLVPTSYCDNLSALSIEVIIETGDSEITEGYSFKGRLWQDRVNAIAIKKGSTMAENIPSER